VDRRLESKAIAYVGDVSQEFHAQNCVQTAINAYGKLDILINNAGVFLATAETQDYPIEVFDDTIRNNMRSAKETRFL
jgi:NAD(P)-dependent dehydrogenase (short-subunit alcohol dehydrogenase family)